MPPAPIMDTIHNYFLNTSDLFFKFQVIYYGRKSLQKMHEADCEFRQMRDLRVHGFGGRMVRSRCRYRSSQIRNR